MLKLREKIILGGFTKYFRKLKIIQFLHRFKISSYIYIPNICLGKCCADLHGRPRHLKKTRHCKRLARAGILIKNKFMEVWWHRKWKPAKVTQIRKLRLFNFTPEICRNSWKIFSLERPTKRALFRHFRAHLSNSKAVLLDVPHCKTGMLRKHKFANAGKKIN